MSVKPKEEEGETTIINITSGPITVASQESPRSVKPHPASLKEMLQGLDASEVVACKDMLVSLLSDLGVEKKGASVAEVDDMKKQL